MCNLITKIEAAEYKGKLYRSAKEAATIALQDVGASIVQYGAANAGVKLLENGATLVSLLTTINPALLPATPEKADRENGQEGPAPEGPARKPTRHDKRTAVAAALRQISDESMGGALSVTNILMEHGFDSIDAVESCCVWDRVDKLYDAVTGE